MPEQDEKIQQHEFKCGFNLERRVSLIEYKLDEFPSKLNEFSDKIEKHEKKSEDLWLRMCNCLEDIKGEISGFKISKFQDASKLETEIHNLKTKVEILENTGKSVWKTVTIAAIIVVTILSAGYSVFKDFSPKYNQQQTQQRSQ